MPAGIVAINAVLNGGLPVGAVTEIVGAECSGRTAPALSLIAQLTKAERVCAWIDVPNALSPESAAASGIDLNRLVWVRCSVQTASQPPSTPQDDFALSEKYLAPPAANRGLHGGSFGPHPRRRPFIVRSAKWSHLRPGCGAVSAGRRGSWGCRCSFREFPIPGPRQLPRSKGLSG
jgi:recombination protein RecA